MDICVETVDVLGAGKVLVGIGLGWVLWFAVALLCAFENLLVCLGS